MDAATEHLKINQIIIELAEVKSVATVISEAKPHSKSASDTFISSCWQIGIRSDFKHLQNTSLITFYAVS